jgi:hypothetical protein
MQNPPVLEAIIILPLLIKAAKIRGFERERQKLKNFTKACVMVKTGFW